LANISSAKLVDYKMLVIGLISVSIVLLARYLWFSASPPQDKSLGKPIPGPRPWPVIGSLHLLGNFTKHPFEAFTRLQEVYGPIFQMRLGTMNAVVINTEEDRREVLQVKGDHFDGRPDFRRFDVMFGGDRRNSLAFCDFDKLQVTRRKMLRAHTFPKGTLGNKLDKACKLEMQHLVTAISDLCREGEVVVDMKSLVVKACSNIFNSYFCSLPRRNYNDITHNKYCDAFDKIFWEVNNGRIVDFLPWLMPMMRKSMEGIKMLTGEVRQFVVEELLEERVKNRVHGNEEERNLLDCLMDQVQEDKLHPKDDDCSISTDIALYALEDILGGHCAVANFALRVFIDIATRPTVQGELRDELRDTLLGGEFSIEERSHLPVMQATFNETVRTTCAPLVPHASNRDTSIRGYRVPANTVIFINNHFSHFHTDYWDQPDTYNPHRFIKEDGTFHKPSHFYPFSFGRRQCMGLKMIDNVNSALMANIFSKFELKCSESLLNQPGGMLALPTGPLYFTVKKLESATRRNA